MKPSKEAKQLKEAEKRVMDAIYDKVDKLRKNPELKKQMEKEIHNAMQKRKVPPKPKR